MNILSLRERSRLGVHILSDLLIGILDIAFLGFLLLVINFYTAGNGANNFLQIRYLFNKNPLLPIGIFLILFSLKNWLGYCISRSQNLFFFSVASRLSRRNMRHYLQGDYGKYVHVDSSVYIRKISQQPIEFSNYILINLQQIVSQGILILLTVTGILFYHPVIFIPLFLLLLPPVIILGYFIKRRLRHVRVNIKETSQLTLQYLKESLSGFVEGNIYDKNDFFTDRYCQYQTQLNENIATQQTMQGLPSRLIEVFAVLGFFILVAINKWSVNTPQISLLDIGVFMTASYKIIPGLVKILNSAGQIKTYEFTLNDLLPPTGQTSADKPRSQTSAAIRSIKFEGVSFNYKGRQLLEDFFLEIAPGDFIGISGQSGLGKTTIINLLLGFLEEEKGRICINNNVTNCTDRALYWQSVSYVKQQAFFMNDTVLKNIILSDDGYDKDKLTEALAFCGIDSLAGKQATVTNKVITENGRNISGGQRQRLMLARALYHDFDLLVLDEPFSELDEAAEWNLLKQLQALAKKGKMIMMITHNKSSLSFCNKIISLDEE